MWDGNPKTYQRWAQEYYGRSVNLDAVKHIYDHQPLNPKIVKILNRELALSDLTDDTEEIGY